MFAGGHSFALNASTMNCKSMHITANAFNPASVRIPTSDRIFASLSHSFVAISYPTIHSGIRGISVTTGIGIVF